MGGGSAPSIGARGPPDGIGALAPVALAVDGSDAPGSERSSAGRGASGRRGAGDAISYVHKLSEMASDKHGVFDFMEGLGLATSNKRSKMPAGAAVENASWLEEIYRYLARGDPSSAGIGIAETLTFRFTRPHRWFRPAEGRGFVTMQRDGIDVVEVFHSLCSAERLARSDVVASYAYAAPAALTDAGGGASGARGAGELASSTRHADRSVVMIEYFDQVRARSSAHACSARAAHARRRSHLCGLLAAVEKARARARSTAPPPRPPVRVRSSAAAPLCGRRRVGSSARLRTCARRRYATSFSTGIRCTTACCRRTTCRPAGARRSCAR